MPRANNAHPAFAASVSAVAPFLPGLDGRRPFHQGDRLLDHCPHSRHLVLFHEYFHGDTGRRLGASHQTGWTGLIAPLLADVGWRVDKEQAKGG